jgi:hypothetical protein
MPGQLHSLTHLSALLVLHGRGSFWLRPLALLGTIPPAEVTQILVLRFRH